MRTHLNWFQLAVLIAVVGWTSLPLYADWPMYRADVSRSGVSREALTLPLTQQWRFETDRKPRPAWPDPVKEQHRLDFDYAPQLVVADGAVLFGSSSDDTVRSLDAETGRQRWAFTTGGPIRFAPACDQGRCYVASDDGFLYCLQAATGELIWKFHAADTNSQVLGNGRLISRRPLRSGVLVDHDVAYVTAGMWPSEGVLIYALNAATGSILWCNDTSDTRYLAQPHAKAYALTGVAPQGYLLATDDLLFVPTGRGVPAAFDRATGKLRYFKPSDSKTHGGCWAMLSRNRLFNGGLVYDAATGSQLPCETTRTPLWAKRDFDYGTRQHILGYRGGRILADGDQVFGRRTGHCLALAGNLLLEGGDGSLTVFDAESKHQSTVLWEAELSGEVRSLAVSDGSVFASTDSGDVYCFGSGDVSKSNSSLPRRKRTVESHPASGTAAVISHLVKAENITAGYAVVINNPALAASLGHEGRFHVLCLMENDEEVSKWRSQFLDDGLIGSEVAVGSISLLQSGSLPAYFANLVIVEQMNEPLDAREIWRIVRPCGGILCFEEKAETFVDSLVAQSEDSPARRATSGHLTWLQRGKLPGAFDWDSEVSSDQRVKWPLELAWFGGPGPARMQDRHRASVAPPVVANGRYFVSGERHIIAVDAYNGTELWAREFATEPIDDKVEALRLTGLTADDTSVYYQIGSTWFRLDAQTGNNLGSTQKLPDGLGSWGRLARRELPFATALRTHALTGENVPRTYHRAYGCNQLLVADGVDFFRSGTLGLYDLEDDSGLRNFGGIRPGCSRSHNAAFGVFLSSEGSSGCVCTYNFQTSLMLAPARSRRQEDWAVYHDLPAAGLVRQININLGAPGDRRDDDGRLWLSHPRPDHNVTLQLPVETAGKLGHNGPYHFDADRRQISNTQRPWIYTTGIRGIRKVTVTLDQQQPLVARRASTPPLIDGRLNEDEWPQEPEASLRPVQSRQNRGAPNRQMIDPSQWSSFVRLAHDDTHLFISYQQPNRLDRRGQPYAWRKKTSGSDTSIWHDDSFELFLSDATRKTVLHFGVSSSGATYDARLQDGDDRESAQWNGAWNARVSADEKAFVTEMAIPWSTLTEAGLSRQQLMVNAQSNWAGWASPLRFLGSRGRLACENFAPLGLGVAPESPPRQFRVRLHFADTGGGHESPGLFDVRLQGRTVLPAFNIREQAGGPNTAIIKEFNGVPAADRLTIELSPVDSDIGPDQETVLSGIEIEESAPR